MFIEFGVKDLVDILLVAYLLYQSYRLMKDSGTINIFIGILVFIGIWIIVSQVLEMRLLGSILDKLTSVGVLAIFILFQDEIRKFLVNLGSQKKLGNYLRFLTKNKKEKAAKTEAAPETDGETMEISIDAE
jgi:DNA integrity scanning protein DisA with diadenylate cyclase activity